MLNQETLAELCHVYDYFLIDVGVLPQIEKAVSDPIFSKWEDRMTRRLEELYGRAGERFLQRLRSLGRIPSDATIGGDYAETIESALDGMTKYLTSVSGEIATDSRNRMRSILEKLGFKVSAGDFPQVVRHKLQDLTFRGSTIMNNRIKRQVMETINLGRDIGQTVGEIVENLKPIVDLQDWQLRRIVNTEIDSASNASQFETMLEGGMEYKQWLNVGDLWVRESHLPPLHGEIKPVNELFSNGLMFPHDRRGRIEEWINCSTGDALIESIGEAKRIFKRFYKGKLVSVKTAKGNEFTVTPNHPILTSRGLVSARLLNEGDQLIQNCKPTEFRNFIPNIENIPSTFEQIYKSLAMVNSIKRVCGLNVNFHGDRGNGKVDVINLKSVLSDRFDAMYFQEICQLIFAYAYILKSFHSSNRSNLPFFKGSFATSYGNIGSSSQLLSLLEGSLSHANKHSLRTITDKNMLFSQNSINGWTAYIPLLSQFANRDSLLIGFDEIKKIRKFNSSAHVYNLEASSGFYFLNNIMSSNCRCRMVAYIPKVRERHGIDSDVKPLKW